MAIPGGGTVSYERGTPVPDAKSILRAGPHPRIGATGYDPFETTGHEPFETTGYEPFKIDIQRQRTGRCEETVHPHLQPPTKP